MTVTDLDQVPAARPSGRGPAGPLREARSWLSGEALERLPRSPSMTLALPGGRRMRIATDRVRAAPALTPTLAGTLGNTGIGLGVWGLLFPRSVGRFVGLDASPQAIQLLFGAREMATGVRLASDPTDAAALWARVAGDAFDIAVLRALDRPENSKRDAVRLALGVVLSVAALDVLAAVRMSTVQRNCA